MSISDRPVFRFAPSPNGELHLGHALSALVGWEAAQAAGGRFLLRIEDIDTGRSRPEYVAGIFADLRWLGLAWEEPVLFQSTRFAAYARGGAAAGGDGAALSLLCHPRRDRGGGHRRSRRTPTARRSIRGSGRAAPPARSPGARRLVSRLRCASTWKDGAGGAGGPAADLHRTRRGWPAADHRRRAGAVGRCRDRAQGHAVELSPGRGGGRCLAGRHARDARSRSLRGHPPAPPAAGAARSARARLSPSSPDHRRRRPQARQERPRHQPALSARSRRYAGRGAPPAWG